MLTRGGASVLHLYSRTYRKLNRTAALTEWRQFIERIVSGCACNLMRVLIKLPAPTEPLLAAIYPRTVLYRLYRRCDNGVGLLSCQAERWGEAQDVALGHGAGDDFVLGEQHG